MPSDSLENPKTTGTTDGDDFTLIRGIAPKTAARLLEAGILTFEKLAGMTPGEIAARIGTNSGISAEGIAKKDWIRQAAELASKVAAARPSGDHPDGDQHSVSYVVQLTLDAQNRVRSSKVHHVQSGDERSWDHWNEVELVSFSLSGLN